MTRTRTLLLALAAAFLPALGAVGTAHAQTYIFALPSASVAPKGSLYIEGDLLPSLTAPSTTIGARGIYGLTDNLELGLNTFGTFSKPPSAAEFQPSLKYRWYNNDDLGLQISSGVVGYIPFTHTSTENPFAMGYTVGRFQTKWAGDYSPAFSAGGWGLLNNNTPGSKAGVILGLEQPLPLWKGDDGRNLVSFAADWMSGSQTHPGFSSFNPGFIISTSANSSLGIGYAFSNVSRKLDTPLLWFGIQF